MNFSEVKGMEIPNGKVLQIEQNDSILWQRLKEASGTVANFPDGTDVLPIKSLVASLTPIQSGTGTPAPDNVRPISGRTQVTVTQRGKNLFDKTSVTPSSMTCYTSSGDPVTRSGIEYYLPAGTYTLKCHSETVYTYVYMNVLDTNGNFVSFASLSMGAAAGWKKVTVTITDDQHLLIFKGTTTTLNLDMDLQIEFGTEATGYEPFVGKNLFDPSKPFRTSGLYYGKAVGTAIERGSSANVTTEVNDNIITVTTKAGWNGVCYRSPNVPNGTYTLSFKINLTNWTGNQNGRDIYVVDSNNIITRTIMHTTGLVSTTSTITLTGDECAIAISLGGRSSTYGTFEIVDLQLESGSVATSYEPYIPHYGINWGKNLIGGLAFAEQVKKVMPAATLDTTAQTISFSGITTSTQSIEIVTGIFKPNTQYTFIHTGTTGNTKNIRWIYDDDSVDTATRPANSAYVSTAGKTVKALEKINNNSTPVTFQYLNCGVFEGVLEVDDFVPNAPEVYGGTVDLVTGVLTINRKTKRISAIDYVLSSPKYIKSDAVDGYTNVSEIYPSKGPTGYKSEELVADRLKFQNKGIWATVGFPNCWTINGIQVHINVANDLLGITDYTQETTATAKTKLNAWLANNPVTIVIPIRPITYQLTPQQISALNNTNNFWNDAGDTKVVYIAKYLD